jgi:hypothetical protein
MTEWLAGNDPIPMHKDIGQSKTLAKRVRSRAKQCFFNCWRVIERLEEYAEATYVEGLAVNRRSRLVLVIEHAWIEHQGVLLDPTLPERDLEYFPGLRFVGRNGLAEATALPTLELGALVIGADGVVAAAALPDLRGCGKGPPIFHKFGLGGAEHEGFQAAREAAERFARDLRSQGR